MQNEQVNSQKEEQRIYIAIDLKSFFASVECRERNLDPLTTNLVVADKSRTEKTICLAVTPSLKAYGIPGRARLFEVVQKVREVNCERLRHITNRKFVGKSYNDIELKKDKRLELDYIIAPPRMGMYMKYSTQIYNIYLKYFSADDIVVYSIDEVFIEITKYLKIYKMRARELVTKVIQDVYSQTGITATAGIGTNLYLCKIAMDIVAKHTKADKYGVRIAGLDEMMYRKLLWNHRPLTDFWRLGKGYAKKLEAHGMYTMGDIARMSIEDEDKLYKMFGVNAELLIDHSWGWESATIDKIKEYRPISSSLNSGQVLHCPYNFEDTRLIIKEMAELMSLDLVRKRIVTNQLVLDVGYDIENIKDPTINTVYRGEIVIDRYGREIPKAAHGTINIDHYTSSTKIIIEHVVKLYEKITDKRLLVRRLNISANNLIREDQVEEKDNEQMNFFIDYEEKENAKKKEEAERKIQRAVIGIKEKYGKNAIVKGMNLQKEGTTMERNAQVGGHKE